MIKGEPWSAAILTFETERLLLRQFVDDDLDPYASGIFADPDVLRYLPQRETPARERAQRTMDFFNEHWAQYSYGPCAVIEKSSGELIGHCGLRFIPELSETEVLYAFAKSVWGKGFATEAACASVDFGFQQLRLKRIIALAVPENLASRRVMDHCGMKYERDMHIFGVDCVYYARNLTDYQASSNNADYGKK
jgi:RimJ/RimL family protein N-acetyltransferase